MSNTLAVWLCFGAFLSPPAPSLWIHWPLTTPLSPHASRPKPHATTRLLPPDQRGQVMRKPSPAGISVTDRRIAKDRTGPDLDERPSILLCHRTRRFLRTNQTILPARRRPTVVHSLVPRGTRRHPLEACLPDGHEPQCLSFPCRHTRSGRSSWRAGSQRALSDARAVTKFRCARLLRD